MEDALVPLGNNSQPFSSGGCTACLEVSEHWWAFTSGFSDFCEARRKTLLTGAALKDRRMGFKPPFLMLPYCIFYLDLHVKAV